VPHGHYADDTPIPPADLIGALAICLLRLPVTNPGLTNRTATDNRAGPSPSQRPSSPTSSRQRHGRRTRQPDDYTLTDWNDEGYRASAVSPAVLRAQPTISTVPVVRMSTDTSPRPDTYVSSKTDPFTPPPCRRLETAWPRSGPHPEVPPRSSSSVRVLVVEEF